MSKYASTGADASLIIQRIHATNSVRLNHKNKEKMQNYYDVLLRRFVAVGDAIFQSGNGGPDLERYEQLNSLTKILFVMSQDSPECAGAVWSRRLGIFQKGVSRILCSHLCFHALLVQPILTFVSSSFLITNNQPYPNDCVM
jgi:nucleolar protein 14